MSIAIFDMDYTLTRHGTWGRFVWRTVRTRPWLWLPLLFETLRNQVEYKTGRKPRGAVKSTMMRWSLRHRRRSELLEMAEIFARWETRYGLRPGAEAALAYHRARGDHILIATAAVDLVAKPIAERLGVDGVVCTDMEWSNERCEERFPNGNCYGQAKREAVEAYLKDHGLSGPTIFYTDSKADFPLVTLVDHTVVVDPKRRTRSAAETLGLPIQIWLDSADGFKPPEKDKNMTGVKPFVTA